MAPIVHHCLSFVFFMCWKGWMGGEHGEERENGGELNKLKNKLEEWWCYLNFTCHIFVSEWKSLG